MSGLILVEAQMDEAAQKIARLRKADGDGGFDPAGQRVDQAGIVVGGAFEKAVDVARRSEAHAQHRRVLGDIAQLIEKGRVEPVFQAQPMRVRFAGENCGAAIGESPIRGGDRNGLPIRRPLGQVGGFGVQLQRFGPRRPRADAARQRQ